MTTWRRLGPWWRVWPDVAAHRLADWRLLPGPLKRVATAACRLRGPHRYRYGVS